MKNPDIKMYEAPRYSSSCIKIEAPIIPFSGVRSSWLILDKNVIWPYCHFSAFSLATISSNSAIFTLDTSRILILVSGILISKRNYAYIAVKRSAGFGSKGQFTLPVTNISGYTFFNGAELFDMVFIKPVLYLRPSISLMFLYFK